MEELSSFPSNLCGRVNSAWDWSEPAHSPLESFKSLTWLKALDLFISFESLFTIRSESSVFNFQYSLVPFRLFWSNSCSFGPGKSRHCRCLAGDDGASTPLMTL